MNSGDVVAVLDRIRRAGIDVWVEGGWGVDALLGEQTRPHDDLDLGVAKEDVDRLCDVLSEFERSDDDWPASFVLRDARGRKLDCHPLAFDAHGDGWQANSSGGPPNRWPRVDLTDRGSIGGVGVPCISPQLQVSWRVYADFDDVDWGDVRRLCERFALDVPTLPCAPGVRIVEAGRDRALRPSRARLR